MSTIVITGASSGIGAAAARALAEQGHELAVVGRDPDRTRSVAAEVGGEPFLADADDLAQIRELASALRERYPRIDVLANNAGGLLARRGLSVDGIEKTWQHNVLAPFVLTTELLPHLEASSARVIFTGSIAHRWGSVDVTDLDFERRAWRRGWPAYGAAKRADMMLAREFSRRTTLDAYSFHPGFVASRFAALDRSPLAGLVSRIAITPEQGAAPLVLLAGSDVVGAPSGSFFDQLKPDARTAAQVTDDAAGAALWNALEKQVERVRPSS